MGDECHPRANFEAKNVEFGSKLNRKHNNIPKPKVELSDSVSEDEFKNQFSQRKRKRKHIRMHNEMSGGSSETLNCSTNHKNITSTSITEVQAEVSEVKGKVQVQSNNDETLTCANETLNCTTSDDISTSTLNKNDDDKESQVPIKDEVQNETPRSTNETPKSSSTRDGILRKVPSDTKTQNAICHPLTLQLLQGKKYLKAKKSSVKQKDKVVPYKHDPKQQRIGLDGKLIPIKCPIIKGTLTSTSESVNQNLTIKNI